MKHFLPILILLFSTSYAYAGQSSATLNMRVSIIQCGERAHIAEACKKESACCAFLPSNTQEDFQLAENTSAYTSTCQKSSVNSNSGFNPLCVETNE